LAFALCRDYSGRSVLPAGCCRRRLREPNYVRLDGLGGRSAGSSPPHSLSWEAGLAYCRVCKGSWGLVQRGM
jgi:hypothetical protein